METKNLRLLSLVPEDKTKQNTNGYGHEEPDAIVLWISPVRPMLFPKTSFALDKEWLGVFGMKIEVLRPW